MSTIQNTLQLPRQFHRTSVSESESRDQNKCNYNRKVYNVQSQYLSRIYESYYDSVFAFLSLKT